MSVLHAPTKRLTVEEYEELGRSGFFGPEERVELLNGQIIPMSPIGYRHMMAVALLNEFFVTRSRRRYLVSPQGPLNLDPRSQPVPDVLLVDRSFTSTRCQPSPAHTYLVIEVADSTVPYDRRDKGPAYALQGIGEYWLLNLNQNVLEVYRKPEGGVYRETESLGPDETVAPIAFPDLVLRVGDFLP